MTASAPGPAGLDDTSGADDADAEEKGAADFWKNIKDDSGSHDDDPLAAWEESINDTPQSQQQSSDGLGLMH